MPENDQQQTRDPFTAFFSEMMKNASVPGAVGMPTGDADAWNRQMQRVFLDAMASYCDDFMRTPQFLDSMKQSMDHALAFRKQVDQFLTEAQRSAQSPALADVDDLCALIGSVEQRLMDRIERLESRLQNGAAVRSAKPAPKTRRTVQTKKVKKAKKRTPARSQKKKATRRKR